MPKVHQSEFLTSAQAADHIGTTVATLNRWAAAGKIPVAHKLPGIRGAYLFRAADIEEFSSTLTRQPRIAS